MKKYFFVCIFLLLLPFCNTSCVMIQTCAPGSPGCYPQKATGNETAPFALKPGGVPIACPQYSDSGCCTISANSQMFLSYILEMESVGEISTGGCPACAANIQLLWCALACSPRQSEFLEVIGLHNITATPTGLPMQVQEIAANISSSFAESVFNSCSGVGLVRSNPNLDTLSLFFNYMGYNQSISVARTLVNFSVLPLGGGGLDLPAYDCCNFPNNLTSPGQPGNTSCPCASCLNECPGGACNKAELVQRGRDLLIEDFESP